MTAREIFKTMGVKGKVLKQSKGGYRNSDDFAYSISRDDKNYHIIVLSKVNPRTYSVEIKDGTTVETLENAILYNEYVARVQENKKNNF